MTRARAALAGALLLAGCGGRVATLNFPTPPPTPAPVPSTTIPDLTKVTLAGVPGQTVVAVPIGGGGATLTGTVVGPAGPVGGADVHVERLVGDAVGATDVTSGPDGSWMLPHVLGGRYRVRAWRPPDLDLLVPQIFFVNGSDTKSLTLTVSQFNAATVGAAIAPNPPVVGQPASLVVEVTTQVVDTQGVVRAQPGPGTGVELIASPGWAVSGQDPTVTAADGSATWEVVCGQPGSQPLTLLVNGTDTYPLNVPPCSPPPATTAPSTSTSTTVTPQTTTTT